MPFQLSASAWLGYEVGRVKSVLLGHLDPEETYTVGEILALLSEFGLDYSNPEYLEIGPQLISDGFLIAV